MPDNPGHVVVAPDKFKGTLTAPQVAEHVAAGLRRACPSVPVVTLPVADGGDGTVESAVAAGYRRVSATVQGPTGEPVSASFAIRDATASRDEETSPLAGTAGVADAILEAAQACGLRRLPGGLRQPLTATSHGAGELISAAVHAGARRIVLGLGGVACTDGGAGLVAGPRRTAVRPRRRATATRRGRAARVVPPRTRCDAGDIGRRGARRRDRGMRRGQPPPRTAWRGGRVRPAEGSLAA